MGRSPSADRATKGALIRNCQLAMPLALSPLCRRQQVNCWKLWNFSLERIASFTIAPLKVTTYPGLFAAAIVMCYGMHMIILTILYGNRVPGFPSILVSGRRRLR
jgi:hypothetical protein